MHVSVSAGPLKTQGEMILGMLLQIVDVKMVTLKTSFGTSVKSFKIKGAP